MVIFEGLPITIKVNSYTEDQKMADKFAFKVTFFFFVLQKLVSTLINKFYLQYLLSSEFHSSLANYIYFLFLIVSWEEMSNWSPV